MNRLLRGGLTAALLASSGLVLGGVMPTERSFIDGQLPVPAAVLTSIGKVFPESSAVGTSYLSGMYDPNLTLSETATVSVTFVWEGAGYRNSLGYFTYETDGSGVTVLDRQLVFPNASFADPTKGWGGGQLATGDTATLRDAAGAVRLFPAGTRIGFFIVANGWTGSAVSGWNAAAPLLPYANPAQNSGVGSGVFTTLDMLNPEIAAGRSDVARHAAMVKFDGIAGFLDGHDFLVTGFEDLRRNAGSDQDFNDLMLLVQSTPWTAIQAVNVPTYDPNNNDPDGDGVSGLADYFPNDPSRAFSTRTPATSYQTLAFEDKYPEVGDADFNDAVVQYALTTVTHASGAIKEIVGAYHLIARGAGYDHSFGVAIDGVPEGATGSVTLERFGSDGTHTVEPTRALAPLLVPLVDGRTSARVVLFESTRAALPGPGPYANTEAVTPTTPPTSVQLRVVFDLPVAPASLATAPFDPFLLVHRGSERYDIHLPGRLPFLGRPSHLPSERGTPNFVDANFYPFALLVPFDWRYPLEAVPIGAGDAPLRAYPYFDDWRRSLGQTSLDWYKTPNTTSPSPRVVGPQTNAVRDRAWTIRAGGL